MGRNSNFSLLRSAKKIVRNYLFALVHYDGHHAAVSIYKRSAYQLASARSRTHPPGTRTDEFRKMADVIIGGSIYQPAGSGVGMHRCETKISDMIWSSLFIQKNIPVSPAYGAAVEVIYH